MSRVSDHGLTERLAGFVAGARGLELPAERLERALCHTLDTVAAIVSGAGLPAGEFGRADALATGGRGEATIALTAGRFPAHVAAFANAMAAHADETDDAHPASVTHPGCAVVPAALAVAQRTGANGRETLAAIVAGYEVCARMGVALGAGRFIVERGFDSHAFGATFGAAAAAGALCFDNPVPCLSVLSLAAQSASGLATLFRDRHHVEKALVFAGKPARDGVWAALAVERGLTGVPDALDGEPSFFSAFGGEPQSAFADIRETWAIENTNIKRWCVGSPAQAALDALEALISAHALNAADIVAIDVSLPEEGAKIVDGRDMPSISVQHLIALMLTDGTVTFHNSHDVSRMGDSEILSHRRKVRLLACRELSRAEPARQAVVALTLKDGRKLQHHTKAVRGSVENPMTPDEVESKAFGLAGAGCRVGEGSAPHRGGTGPELRRIRSRSCCADRKRGGRTAARPQAAARAHSGYALKWRMI